MYYYIKIQTEVFSYSEVCIQVKGRKCPINRYTPGTKYPIFIFGGVETSVNSILEDVEPSVYYYIRTLSCYIILSTFINHNSQLSDEWRSQDLNVQRITPVIGPINLLWYGKRCTSPQKFGHIWRKSIRLTRKE